MRLVLDPTIRIFKLLNTAAVTTMVVQPNAALGNAPKNPRYILYYVCTIWAKFRWSKKRINIISDQFPLLSTPCHYDKMPTPNSNYFYRMPEQKPSKRLFLSQAASFTHRSYLRLSFPPSWRFRIANSCWETAFHRQGVSFKHHQKIAEFVGITTVVYSL
jgi:hypothetical protein